MDKQQKKLLNIQENLENEIKVEFLKYLDLCRHRIQMSDAEKDVNRFINEYSEFLQKSKKNTKMRKPRTKKATPPAPEATP